MFSWLLEVVNSGVVGDVVAPDNIADGYITQKINTDLRTGILIGFLLALFLWVIIKLSIHFFKKAIKDINNQEDE